MISSISKHHVDDVNIICDGGNSSIMQFQKMCIHIGISFKLKQKLYLLLEIPV